MDRAHRTLVFPVARDRTDDPVSAVIRAYEAAFTELTGYASEEILGRPGILLGGARLDLHHLRQLEALSAEPSGGPWVLTTTKERRDRTRYQVEVTIRPVRDGLDEITHYVVAQREIF